MAQTAWGALGDEKDLFLRFFAILPTVMGYFCELEWGRAGNLEVRNFGESGPGPPHAVGFYYPIASKDPVSDVGMSIDDCPCPRSRYASGSRPLQRQITPQ